jgi:acyl-CoA hydrolase
MNHMQEYHAKLTTAERAVKVIQSGDWVDYNFTLSQPSALDKALAARKNELVNVKVRGGFFLRPLEIVIADQEREHFFYNSWHFSPYERKLSDRGLCNYIPMVYQAHPDWNIFHITSRYYLWIFDFKLFHFVIQTANSNP